ncbi:putative ribosome hibernation promotion factor [Vairimorpha necatrix]|uniref:Ribosome hibernation promotion factor n=1 Tax=Vairimorpha necatrix TaxID=6039 RepID=A0AAX4JAV9_9MICR
MNISNFFWGILAVQGNKLAYNKIKDKLLEVIENKDYISTDPTLNYNFVHIFNYKHEEKKCMIKVRLSIWNKDEYTYHDLHIDCKNKLINDIIDEIEDICIFLLNYPSNNPIILSYEESELNTLINLDNSFTIKNVIDYIKQRNDLRKDGYEIYYENICMINSMLEKVIHRYEIFNLTLFKPESSIDVILKYVTLLEHTIRFYLKIDNKHVLFEFCIEDLFDLAAIKIKSKNYVDILILKKIIELSKLSCDNFNSFYIKEYTLPITCTANSIEILGEGHALNLEIYSDKIIFKEDDKKYVYYVRNKASYNCIERECQLELIEILKVFDAMNNSKNIKGVILIFNLLKDNNKILFLIEKIINQKGSGLNILFKFLFFINDSICKDLLNFMPTTDGLCESHYVDLSKFFYEHLSAIPGPKLYLIQICILIETERYINENDVSEDIIFRTFKDIISLLKIENNNQICGITSLFVGLDENIHLKHDSGLLTENCIIEDLKLDKNEIRINNEIIRSKLLINNKEDKKHENIRNIKKKEMEIAIKILEDCLTTKDLPEILESALYTNMECFFNDVAISSFEKELIDKSKDVIDKIFNNSLLLKNTNEEIRRYLLVRTKKEYNTSIKCYIKENIKKNKTKYLHEVLIKLLENEFEDVTNKKTICEKNYNHIRSTLQEKCIIRIFNEESEKLHDDLIKILKNQDTAFK